VNLSEFLQISTGYPPIGVPIPFPVPVALIGWLLVQSCALSSDSLHIVTYADEGNMKEIGRRSSFTAILLPSLLVEPLLPGQMKNSLGAQGISIVSVNWTPVGFSSSFFLPRMAMKANFHDGSGYPIALIPGGWLCTTVSK